MTGDHLGGVRVLAPDPFLEVDRTEEPAFVFEHRADGRVVVKAGGDGGPIDEPRAFELADIGVGFADNEDFVVGDFELWEAFAQQFEELDDLAGVVELGSGVNP